MQNYHTTIQTNIKEANNPYYWRTQKKSFEKLLKQIILKTKIGDQRAK